MPRSGIARQIPARSDPRRPVAARELSALDQAASEFVSLRPRLIGLARQILGSSMDAEDIVQEVWLRWQAVDRAVVMNQRAYLTTATTRLAINVAQSARSRWEVPVTPGLPEPPEPADARVCPELAAERSEALELALLLLLERLSPTERAAYLLREAFDYPYERIAYILQVSAANARQLVSRARKGIAVQRREPARAGDHRRLLWCFRVAAETGELAPLEAYVRADVA